MSSHSCLFVLLLSCALLVRFATGAATEPEYAVSVLTDRNDATYHARETVTFNITVSHHGTPVPEGKVVWSTSQDGVAPLQSGTTDFKDGHAVVTGQLAAPGFLQCRVDYKAEKELVRGLGAAAVDPLQIRPSLSAPSDFDAFWAAQKLRLKAVPINAKLVPLPAPESGIELFDVQADTIGDQPMRGLYARPAGARPKSLPAIITLEGAGVYSTRTTPWLVGWAKDGFISLELNAHGLPNGKPAGYYQDLERGALKDYQLFGRTSRDTFYFLNMYLRALRGADFLASQPEWDGRVLISSGAKQGGAQAIFLAAEDPRVTFLSASIPGMCDHSGMLAGRVVGWPRLVPVAADGKPDPAVLETSRYFDKVNFAARVHVPALFLAGFIDQTAPPTSVYAAYNNVPSLKEMFPAIHSPHKVEPEVWQEVRRRVLLKK